MEPINSTKLAKLCKQKLDRSKTTTYTVIKCLSELGVVKNGKTTVYAEFGDPLFYEKRVAALLKLREARTLEK